MKWDFERRFVVLTIWIFVGVGQIEVSAETLYRFRPGVHISQVHPLLDKQRRKIVSGLRSWTGLTQLDFDEKGDLVLGDRSKVNDGSTTARALIIQAVDSSDSFSIERCDKSDLIAFAQVADTDRYMDGSGAKHLVWELRIDFSDFQELSGNNDALSSFDAAAGFIHELTHAVKGYSDSVSRYDQLGECEVYVNVMRAELGLPRRVFYYPRQQRAMNVDGQTFVQGELSFVYESSTSREHQEVFLHFNIEKIFDLTKAKSRAQVETNLIAQKLAAGR